MSDVEMLYMWNVRIIIYPIPFWSSNRGKSDINAISAAFKLANFRAFFYSCVLMVLKWSVQTFEREKKVSGISRLDWQSWWKKIINVKESIAFNWYVEFLVEIILRDLEFTWHWSITVSSQSFGKPFEENHILLLGTPWICASNKSCIVSVYFFFQIPWNRNQFSSSDKFLLL